LEEYGKILGDAFKSTKDLSKDQIEEMAKQNGVRKKEIEDLIELKKKYEELGEAGVASYDEMAPKFKDLATKMGVLSPKANRLAGNFSKFAEALKSKDGRKGVVAGFREAFNAKNLFLSLTSKVIEQTLKLAFAVDNATAAFAKSTGAGRMFTEEIMTVGGGFRNLGLDADGAGKAVGALFNNLTGFAQSSKKDRVELVKTVASLEKIGVSGETAAKNIQLMQENFGMSTKEATKMTRQISIAGTKIGISASKMMEGFASASKSLAVYGKDAIKVFTDLAAQAKAAGVEAATLLGLAEKFDTFSGSADAVGKLNSILGTNLSAIDMLNMKENERIETMIRSIQAQGIAFKDLGRFEQKAVAAAAGISDLAEAQRIFGMSVNDYRKGLKDAAEEEEFNKRLQEAMSAMEKLTKIAQNFAIQMAPAINFIADLVQGFLNFSQSMKGIPAIIIGVVFAFKALTLVFPLVTGLLSGMLTGIGGLSLALPNLGVALGAMGTAASSGALGLGLIIGVVLALAAAFYAAAEAASAFYNLFYGGGQDQQLALEKTKVTLVKAETELVQKIEGSTPRVERVLGAIALAATGLTTATVTGRASSLNSVGQIANTIENAFNPEVKVYIGDKELKDIIKTEVTERARQ